MAPPPPPSFVPHHIAEDLAAETEHPAMLPMDSAPSACSRVKKIPPPFESHLVCIITKNNRFRGCIFPSMVRLLPVKSLIDLLIQGHWAKRQCEQCVLEVITQLWRTFPVAKQRSSLFLSDFWWWWLIQNHFMRWFLALENFIIFAPLHVS